MNKSTDSCGRCVESAGNSGVNREDRSQIAAAEAQVFDTLDEHPFFRAYRRRMFEILRPLIGQVFLEVGTGTGRVARTLAETFQCRVVAVDLQRRLAEMASRVHSSALALQGDAHALSFAGETFHGVWGDRVVHHLHDPLAFLAEAFRVLKPGGKICLVEPDQCSMFLAFPDERILQKILRYRSEVAIRHGTIAHRMPELLDRQGFTEISSESLTVNVRDPKELRSMIALDTWGTAAYESGVLNTSELKTWEEGLARQIDEGRFLWGVTFFFSCARKP